MSEQRDIETWLRHTAGDLINETVSDGDIEVAKLCEAADEIASLRAQLAEEKAKHALTIQHSDQIGRSLASARKALDDSQSLLTMLHHLGSDRPSGIASLDWDNEELTKLTADQITENRSVLTDE